MKIWCFEIVSNTAWTAYRGLSWGRVSFFLKLFFIAAHKLESSLVSKIILLKKSFRVGLPRAMWGSRPWLDECPPGRQNPLWLLPSWSCQRSPGWPRQRWDQGSGTQPPSSVQFGHMLTHYSCYNRLFLWTRFRQTAFLTLPKPWVFVSSFEFFAWVLWYFSWLFLK